MSEKLSERLERFEFSDELGNGDFSVIIEAAAIVRAVEDAPVGRVDMLCAKDAVLIDELPEYFVYRINKQRVKLVEVVG